MRDQLLVRPAVIMRVLMNVDDWLGRGGAGIGRRHARRNQRRGRNADESASRQRPWTMAGHSWRGLTAKVCRHFVNVSNSKMRLLRRAIGRRRREEAQFFRGKNRNLHTSAPARAITR